MTNPKNPDDPQQPPKDSGSTGGASPAGGRPPADDPAGGASGADTPATPGSAPPPNRPSWGEPTETTSYPSEIPPYPGGGAHYPAGDPTYGTAPGAGYPGQGGGQPGPGGYPPPPGPDQGGHPAYPPQYQTYGTDEPEQHQGPQTMSIVGFVCAAVALFFCPILFGPVGIVLGVIGHGKGERLGKWAAIASAVALVVGLVAGLAFFNTDMMPDQS
ncbi:hypothetical protein IU443_19160 [Nocardia farcinica]|uniref:DUF4190 domain-containing protein n=1 Tax=Nocardia farcinica TaxID=37329 RepID=UPI001894A2B8|nr:DUF4190 domain-containing protein [Nocardia farcinica]MBF6264218.1 hypothetical protein [Nocardia farcinica]MBF6282631.1 hypothetical protein [Nocardia farcinica]MBF6308715.1 hypothetical protein [Nocardia farcinica]MBF6392067.1 hypothetical protein [Nocardia farcinica]MBF6490002.1 hypothetical protein [Nocardia farcinica]